MELAPKNGPKGTMISMNHCKKELKDTQESVLFLSEFHEKTLDIFKSVKTDPIKNKEIRRKTPNGFAEMRKKMNLAIVVKKMKNKMTNFLLNRNFEKLNDYHFNILQDNFYDDKNENTKIISKKFGRFHFFIQALHWFFTLIRFPIILSNNKLKIFWDFFMISIILSNFFAIFLDLCYDNAKQDEKDGFYFYWHWKHNFVILAAFSVDLVQKFNSGYFEDGLQILDRISIIERYIKTELFYDCFSFTGLWLGLIFNLYLESTFYHNLFRWLFFFKYPNLKQMVMNFDEMISVNEKIEAIISLFKLFIKMVFLAHIIACFWCCLPYWFKNDENWMQEMGIFDKPIIDKYLISLYWAVVSISTVGYGDIIAKNKIEYLFCTFVVVIGSIFFGYSLSYISSIIYQLEKEEVAKKDHLHILNRYMKKNTIDFETQLQIKKYVNFLWENKEKYSSENEQQIFNSLTSNLKEKILLQTYGKILFPVPLFSKNFSKNFLTKILSIMKPLHFEPNSIIYAQGEIGNNALFIVEKGEISLNVSKKGENLKDFQLKTIKEGEVFGDFEFFTKKERIFTARSISYSSVYVIYLKDFEELLKTSLEDQEQYYLMKDQLNLYQNYELLFQKNCSSCQEKKSNHLIFQCPLINFTCKKHLLIAKNNFSFSQKRSNFSRRKKKTPLFYIPFNKTKKKIVSSHLIPRCQTNPELNHLLIQPIGIQKCQSSPKLFADDRLNFKKNPLDLENFNKKKIELDILEDPDVLSKNSEIQIILDKDYDMEPIQNQIKLDFNLFKEKDYSKVEIDPYNYSDADEDKSEACSPKNLKKLYNFDKNYQNESSEEEDCEENNPNSFESAVEKSLEETKINKKQNKTKIDPNFRILKEFDKMHLFDKYFPLGNYTIVLWNLERKPKIFGNKRKKLFKNKRDSLSSLVKAWKSSSKRKSNKI